MRIEERAAGSAFVLAPEGSLDLQSSAAFQDRLLAAVERGGPGGPLVVVDLAGVPFISSAGLRALLVASRKAEASGGKLAISSLTPVAREIVRIARFDLLVRIFDGPREALEWLDPHAAEGGEHP